MRANTFAGQVIAVLSRRAPAFQLKPTEPHTLPGRISAFIRQRRRTASVSPTASISSQAIASEESHVQADQRLASAYVGLASGGGGLGSEGAGLGSENVRPESGDAVPGSESGAFGIRGAADDLDGLVSSAIDGSQQAVDSIIRWIRPLVARYCKARLGRQESTLASAEDVAQDICLTVLAELPNYHSQGRPFLSFVYGIAARKVAEVHRSAARNRALQFPAIPNSPAAMVDGPERQVMQAELAERMTKLLGTLPEKEREILILRIVVGLSAEETADAIGSTPAAVRVAQYRALGVLRKTLESGRVT